MSKKINSPNNVLNYGWDTTDGPCSCDFISPKIIKILNFLKAKRVVDVASGNGALAGLLKRNNFDIVGVEYDAEGFNISVNTYPNINFYNFSVEDDPNQILKLEKDFDAVVSTEVVEHLYSPHLLPIFSGPLLREGGYLILSTPYHGFFKNLAISLFNHWDAHHTALWHGGHIKFGSKKTLTTLLENNGFKVIYFYGVGRMPFLWKSMILVAVKFKTTEKNLVHSQ